MIHLLQKDYDFPELKEIIEKDLMIEEQTIQQLEKFVYTSAPNVIEVAFSTDTKEDNEKTKSYFENNKDYITANMSDLIMSNLLSLESILRIHSD